jgi:hypothetical protein
VKFHDVWAFLLPPKETLSDPCWFCHPHTINQGMEGWRGVFFPSRVTYHVSFESTKNKLELENGCWLEWRYSSSFVYPHISAGWWVYWAS